MSDYRHLKDVCKKNDQALTISFKPNGDVLIYVNPDCSENEFTQSMLLATTRILQERDNKK